ncbi:hypothetical protein AB0L82_36375 [Nocardia sp. NPDC052001]|uniref:hypothetical protein n=1 Tax=Nocardia sp. NPDC052001 TaxID=3154853 RepID=UPI003449C2D6
MVSSAIARIAAPTAATALVTTALAIAINLATDGEHSPWLWAGVGALTLTSFALSMWLHHRQNGSAPTEPARGLVLTDVEAAGMETGNIRSEATGAEIRKSTFTRDLKFGDITAGPEHPPTP